MLDGHTPYVKSHKTSGVLQLSPEILSQASLANSTSTLKSHRVGNFIPQKSANATESQFLNICLTLLLFFIILHVSIFLNESFKRKVQTYPITP